MPLSAFPKTFGLTEPKKGHFPHLFNTPENQDYFGPIPEKKFFMPESMSVSGRKEFEKWHNEQLAKNAQVDFQKELVEHCESGIKLLKEGCLTFKRLFEPLPKFNLFDPSTASTHLQQPLHRGHVQRRHQHCMRVPGLLLAQLPDVLPKPHRKVLSIRGSLSQ